MSGLYILLDGSTYVGKVHATGQYMILVYCTVLWPRSACMGDGGGVVYRNRFLRRPCANTYIVDDQT